MAPLARLQVKALASGQHHTLCLTIGGDVYSFGASNEYGELGCGDHKVSQTPINLSDHGQTLYKQKVVSITAAVNSSMAVTADGNGPRLGRVQ